ncbi:PREDICTED: paired amphipathic helix protein Sin3-like 2 [Camelina sativa]|uniref:Paired amphipathic helix protein Sin3-like 2 n=1 Tax=Camelina sativa TaxID=90675 RepID=A0ABM0VB83_CAMSA|nr:PREDICTED: paired amphipathic helix protein Sin3-like 2 [Camelina sativa]
MKRIRDDPYATGSQFKRPLGSSRGESYGQSPVPGNGGTGGDSIADGGVNNQKLTTDDALAYLKEVKEMFQDQRDKYDMFLEVMKDFKAQRTDTSGVIARVKELFKGHNNLIFGFNTFLPKGFEITLDEEEEEEAPPRKTVEFEEAISFVNKIKKRFQHDELVYRSFLDILNMYRKDNKDITEVYNEVSTLFEDHSDLLEEFTRFLPDSLAPHTAAQLLRSQAQRYDDRRSGPPLVPRMFMEKDRRRERVVASWGDRDHSVDRSDLNDDKATVKMHRDQRKRIDKDNRERRSRDFEDGEAEQDNLQHFSEKRKSSRKAEGFEAYSGPASNSEKNNLKSMCNQAFVFCEKVKERLCSQDDYQSFLRCLNIFSKGIIQKKDLQNLISGLLGKFPDLMDEFNQFFERCESIDGFQHLAGVMSKKSLSSEEQVSRSMKGEEKEREQKRDLEAAKEKERSKDKYMGKSIQELDLSDCERCTPSYRLLPPDYPTPSVRHRQKSGAAVLNDHWVSVTSGSEDYSFKHMRRNQYEESLFRCEDDRFELDMLLESVGSAAKSTEELLNIIIEKKISFEGSFRIEDHLTALNLRCIERLYGDHGLDVTDMIRKNPASALPVILTRLKQKQDEWTKCREGFNVVWADVYAKNHYKSLDHRSFYFKQQDSKNLSAKALVSEIKDLKEKSQKEDDVLLSISAGYRQPIATQLKYEYMDRTIHEDLFNLVQFSCEEICSSKEQIGKVLRLWGNFLELMLGVPPKAKGSDSVEVVVETKHHSAFTSKEANVSSEAIGSVSRKLNLAANGDEHTSSGVSKNGRTGLLNKDSSGKEIRKDVDPANKDVATCAENPQKDQEVGNGADKGSGDVDERVATSCAAVPSVVETNNGKVRSGDSSGSRGILSKPSEEAIDKVDTIQRTQGDDIGRTIVSANGMQSDALKANSNYDESGGPAKIKKEEGELSPIGDSEDNFVVYEDHGVNATAKPEHIVEAEEENDDDADGEDGDDASEAGEDASGTESIGDECSQEDNGVEEEGEHDEIDGKAESEGEAEGMESHLIEEDKGLFPSSERVLLSVKPLSKHVAAAALLDERNKECRVFYGNEDFYVLFRLHQFLYERILSAKTYCTGGETKQRNTKDKNSPDPYARFMNALFSLLNGSADNSKFEDECRAIIGNQSYVLFTLEKLIYKLVKQLQAVVADDMDNKLLQLYEYENSRKHGRVIDSVYYENARILLHEENIYRLECSSSPPCLSIQLMDNITEKPEASAVTMDPTFASYLKNEFLSNSSGKKELQDIVLQKYIENKRGYSGLDDLAVACKAMEGVQVINGLECKMSCSSYKISYVLDTEDFFHRKKKQKKSKNLSLDKSSQNRIERFHRFLAASR